MIFAWFGALAIGLSLGLLGSGGSILTVPVLVYLVGQADKVAIAGSLAIVGGISLVGAIPYALRRRIDWRSVLLFGIPGMAGTYFGAFLAAYVSGAFQLLLFAVIMLLAAAMMLRPSPEIDPSETPKKQAVWKVGLEGLTVGVITGLVGVGGGFLIVPALVLLGGLPMHMAIGTSLIIIAFKSFSGFYKYTQVLQDLGLSLDWGIIALMMGLGIVGSFAGNAIGSKVPQAALRRGFAVFLIVMGTFILWQNVPGVFADTSPRELLVQAGFASDTVALGPITVSQTVLHALVSLVVFLGLEMMVARGSSRPLRIWGWSAVGLFLVVGRLADVALNVGSYTGNLWSVFYVGQGFTIFAAVIAAILYSLWYFDTHSEMVRRAMVPVAVATVLWLSLTGLQVLAHSW